MFGLLMRHITRPLAIMLSAEIGSLSTTRVHVDALALMGCPDLGIDRFSHYMQMPFPNFFTLTLSAQTQSCSQSNRFTVFFTTRHHCPGHSYDLVGQRYGCNLCWSARQ